VVPDVSPTEPAGQSVPSELWRIGAVRAALRLLAGLGAALLAIRGFHAVGAQFYGEFWIPQGNSMYHLPPAEFAFLGLFIVFGLMAGLGSLFAFGGMSWRDPDMRWLYRCADRGAVIAIGLGAFVGTTTFLIAKYVLEHAVLTDDENTYRFIAETLRTGALTAPSPGTDLDFYREQFVVLTNTVRYGKYPIGHPILLAIGQVLGAEAFVVPLVTALGALVLYGLGTRIAGRGTATLAVLLYALSPQVILTGATLLSQPASALALTGSLAALVAAEQSRRPGTWLAIAGFGLGYGILIRPLPGVLFALVAAGYVVLTWGRPSWIAAAGRSLAFAVPLGAMTGLVPLVNRLQSGSAARSGYHALHAPDEGVAGILASLHGDLPTRSMSLFGNVLRLDVWLLGWPISLALCPFARRTRHTTLLWAMVAATGVYRLIAPKTGVGATGPIYFFEVVPLLCLLSADGLGQLVARARRGPFGEAAAGWAIALVLCGTLVSATMFLPVAVANVRRMADAQLVLPRMLHAVAHGRVLVFQQYAVPPWLALSWAYYPRANSPRLDDEILYVQQLAGSPERVERNFEFWQRRYPDRAAWAFTYQGKVPQLVPLEPYLDAWRRGRAPDSGGPLR
jgi:4-amino-4-deoxy-L-arabinose transferase-like glycosyltransferase